jgi:hypothetical protein
MRITFSTEKLPILISLEEVEQIVKQSYSKRKEKFHESIEKSITNTKSITTSIPRLKKKSSVKIKPSVSQLTNIPKKLRSE